MIGADVTEVEPAGSTAKAPPQPEPKGSDGGAVDLGGRYEILPSSPLPDLTSPGGPAFGARNLKDRKTSEFAIICTQPVPARIDALGSVRSMEHPALLRLVDWGTVLWAPERKHRLVLIYERPQGGRLA